jgi:hypothetical protein
MTPSKNQMTALSNHTDLHRGPDFTYTGATAGHGQICFLPKKFAV